MMKKVPCPKCDGWGHISVVGENSISSYRCAECCGTGQIEIHVTNADRIRSMSDEELAKFIPNWSYTNACKCGEHYVDCNNECEKCVAEWLQQPAEEGGAG